MNPLGNYQPGTSILHRASPGSKLLGLTIISGVAMVWRNPISTTALLALAVVGFLVGRVRLGFVLRALRRLLIIIVLVGGYQVWQRGWEPAYVIVGNIVGLILLATLLTAVTPVDQMLDTITSRLGPLRRFGVRPDWVALAFSLMIRAIPDTMQTGRETRHAALARGLDRSPRAYLSPLVIRTVARARLTGDALHARNLLDDD